MDSRAYLEAKTEVELRGFAFKLGVRMTGPRADLLARLELAAMDLGRDRFRQVSAVQTDRISSIHSIPF